MDQLNNVKPGGKFIPKDYLYPKYTAFGVQAWSGSSFTGISILDEPEALPFDSPQVYEVVKAPFSLTSHFLG